MKLVDWKEGNSPIREARAKVFNGKKVILPFVKHERSFGCEMEKQAILPFDCPSVWML